MIALFLALFAADRPKSPPPPPPPVSIDGLPVGGIGRQTLPARGCAAYLFSTGRTRVLVAMAKADPATLRIALDGVTADYARVGQQGETEGSYGFARSTEYAAGALTATLDMTITSRADLTQGAAVPEAVLRIDRVGKDSVILPVAGLIGCKG